MNKSGFYSLCLGVFVLGMNSAAVRAGDCDTDLASCMANCYGSHLPPDYSQSECEGFCNGEYADCLSTLNYGICECHAEIVCNWFDNDDMPQTGSFIDSYSSDCGVDGTTYTSSCPEGYGGTTVATATWHCSPNGIAPPQDLILLDLGGHVSLGEYPTPVTTPTPYYPTSSLTMPATTPYTMPMSSPTWP